MAKKNYFKIVQAGFEKGLQREEIEINAGEHGKIMIYTTDEGFVIDVYGQNDIVDTMAIWEDDVNPEVDEDEIEKDDDGNCKYCGQKCWEGQMCDEQQASGFNQSPFEDGQPRDEDGILTTCPVCGSENTRKDHDFPKTMRCCKGCLSEWNINDEITLNTKEVK